MPVVIGASEGERTFIGARNLAALVKSAQADGNTGPDTGSGAIGAKNMLTYTTPN